MSHPFFHIVFHFYLQLIEQPITYAPRQPHFKVLNGLYLTCSEGSVKFVDSAPVHVPKDAWMDCGEALTKTYILYRARGTDIPGLDFRPWLCDR